MVNGFEERLKAVHRTARYAQMKVDDLVETYVEDIKNLKVIVTRQENTLQAMDLRLARAMRMIHMLTHPLLNSKFKKKKIQDSLQTFCRSSWHFEQCRDTGNN